MTGAELKDLWFGSREMCRDCKCRRTYIWKREDSGTNMEITRRCTKCTMQWTYHEFPSSKDLVPFRQLLFTQERLRKFYVQYVEGKRREEV
jgi:hypothetical protein